MRKISIFLYVCFITNFSFAQDYLISFSGSGESNLVASVKVENLTQSKSLTLNGSDVLNLKKVPTGISDIELLPKHYIKVYPNPANDYSFIQFPITVEGNTIDELFDVSGRILVKANGYLPAGQEQNSLEENIIFSYTTKEAVADSSLNQIV